MIEAGAKLRLWDPVAEERFAELFPQEKYFKSPLETAEGADLLLILTDWPEVKNIDLEKLKNTMRCPVIVDGRNQFDPKAIREKGFTYISVGRA